MLKQNPGTLHGKAVREAQLLAATADGAAVVVAAAAAGAGVGGEQKGMSVRAIDRCHQTGPKAETSTKKGPPQRSGCENGISTAAPAFRLGGARLKNSEWYWAVCSEEQRTVTQKKKNEASHSRSSGRVPVFSPQFAFGFLSGKRESESRPNSPQKTVSGGKSWYRIKQTKLICRRSKKKFAGS
jgi:hypothetical protein